MTRRLWLALGWAVTIFGLPFFIVGHVCWEIAAYARDSAAALTPANRSGGKA